MWYIQPEFMLQIIKFTKTHTNIVMRMHRMQTSAQNKRGAGGKSILHTILNSYESPNNYELPELKVNPSKCQPERVGQPVLHFSLT